MRDRAAGRRGGAGRRGNAVKAASLAGALLLLALCTRCGSPAAAPAGTGNEPNEEAYTNMADRDADAPPAEGGEAGAVKLGRFTNQIGMTLVLVPAGGFLQGSPREELGREAGEGLREVEIARPFWMGTHEVTQGQYEQVMGEDPSTFRGAARPVDSVSWNDAVEFCRRLSEREGRVYRLPSETEWEYACRAGTSTAYCFGDDPARLGDYAWYAWNSGGTTHEVGLKQPNAWGLYDMHGNVWEWCREVYGQSERGGERPAEPDAPVLRVVRGGSYFDHPSPLRCASRGRNIAFNHSDDHGFRVVCESAP